MDRSAWEHTLIRKESLEQLKLNDRGVEYCWSNWNGSDVCNCRKKSSALTRGARVSVQFCGSALLALKAEP